MPGFALAKKAAEVFEQNPSVEGLMLLGHGHFAFGETAKESYDQIIVHTQKVADYLKIENPTNLFNRNPHRASGVFPIIRGLIGDMIGPNSPMPIMDLRNGKDAVSYTHLTLPTSN